MHKHKKIRRIIMAVLLCSPITLPAQLNETGGIMSFKVSTKLLSGLDGKVSQEFRFDENLTHFNRSATTAELVYTLIRKKLLLGADYDLLCYNQENRYELRQRAALSLTYKQEFRDFSFSLRTRGQATFRDEATGEYKFNPRYLWRNKLGCSYRIFGSRFKPFGAMEIACPINSKQGFYMNKYRVEAGTSYRYSRHVTLEAKLRFDQGIQEVDPQNILYGCFGWNYKF